MKESFAYIFLQKFLKSQIHKTSREEPGCLPRPAHEKPNNTDRCIFEVMPNEEKIFGFAA